MSSPRRQKNTEETNAPPLSRSSKGYTFSMKEHPTTTYIKPVRESYAKFSKVLHEFAEKCFISKTNPELLNQLTLVSRSFDHFIQQASIFYQGVNLDPRGRTSIQTSSLSKAARTFVDNWIDLANIMNDVYGTGLSRFYNLIPQYFASLQLDFDQTLISFENYSFKTDVPAGAVRRMSNKVYRFKDRAHRLLNKCNNSNRDELENGEYFRSIQAFVQEIHTFFRVDVPKQTLVTGDILKIKSQVNISAGELERFAAGTLGFGDQVEATKKSFIECNSSIEKLFEAMDFPFELKIEFVDETPVAEQQIIQNDTEKEDSGNDEAEMHLEKLQKQLNDIDSTIGQGLDSLK